MVNKSYKKSKINLSVSLNLFSESNFRSFVDLMSIAIEYSRFSDVTSRLKVNNARSVCHLRMCMELSALCG